MELVPWKPFGELGSLRKEMDNLWNRFFEQGPFPKTTAEWMPLSDISETKNKIIVKLDIPGLDAQDINVSISGDLLVIKGEKKKESEEKGEHHYRMERYYGAFERSFRLPVEVKADKVEAKVDKGVLKITMPKTESAKKKEIEVKVS